ncbi:bcl-2-like protein 12 [Poecilia reticulata]|uniref:bcl-2-like protein 12 n=1 Tax=Poecilia reticulata TaxID=8081 RepID=UPI0007EB7BCC|nr:PREDICTED: bcl-2-like protein 12 [Poecilia reticulata]
MSEPADRRCSVSSVSLIEIKTETHRVLQAFLERTISTPHKDRPGRIAGAYDDHNKHSSSPQSKRKDGADAQTEKEDDKKTGIKDLMKRSIIRGKGSLGRSSKPKQSHPTEDSLSPSSSSDEEVEKLRKQKQVIKKKIASFFKKKLKEKKEKEKDQKVQNEKEQDKKAAAANKPFAPGQFPEFYNEIAQKLEDIIKQSTKIKTPSPKLKRPPVSTSPTLQRIAISMEVSRRMVTATGMQRIEGFAERYMDNFIPWVKSHGGWGKVLDIDKTEEWD